MVDQPLPQEMNVVSASTGLDLPPGFRFHPSDTEIVSDYLMNKVQNRDFTCIAMGEVDLNKTEPWDLPNKAKFGEKEWYFFYQKDRKYPAGLRANRATEAGYWKATGKDKEVYKAMEGVVLLVGMKKTLVFYKGRAPRGEKTKWVMHEYRLEGSDKNPSPASGSSSATNNVTMKALASASKDDWVVCRLFKKTIGIKKTTTPLYQVAMAATENDQNLNNIQAIPFPLQLSLPVPVPVPTQFPILPDFPMDPVPPYYSNDGTGMSPMMTPMVGTSGVGGLQINTAPFSNQMVASPPINFYHQVGMGAAVGQIGTEVAVGQMGIGEVASQMGIRAPDVQMDMGASGANEFDVVAPKSRTPLMVSQKDELANANEISLMMSMTRRGSAITTIDIDDTWNYNY